MSWSGCSRGRTPPLGAQLGITITSIGLGFVAQPYIAAILSPLLEHVFSPRTADGVALVIALALATVLQLVFAEVVPKNVAVSRPEATGLALAPAMRRPARCSVR